MGYYYVFVDYKEIFITDNKGAAYEYITSTEFETFIIDYDEGEKVSPTNFIMDFKEII